jgi:Tfp pilus assembly protein PilX
MKTIHYQKNNRGFILLFTIVVISVTVGITVSLLHLSSRGAALGALQSNAQLAFAAADSGLECGLMMTYATGTTNSTPVNCGSNTSMVNNPASLDQEQYAFDFQAAATAESATEDNIGGCGIVLIKRNASWNDAAGVQTGILVESYGYNICIPRTGTVLAKPDLNNPSLVERKMIARIPELSSI